MQCETASAGRIAEPGPKIPESLVIRIVTWGVGEEDSGFITEKRDLSLGLLLPGCQLQLLGYWGSGKKLSPTLLPLCGLMVL